MTFPAFEDPVRFPDQATSRLFERAKREQWQVETDIPWDSFQLDLVGDRIQRAMATIYTQIQYGEMLALSELARVVHRDPDAWVKLFGATQVMDEARHVELFSRTLAIFPDKAELSQALVFFGERLRAAREPEEVLLGTQVILEGFAQCLFTEGARLGRAAADRASPLGAGDGPLRFLDALERFVGRDESRHVAFGVLLLRQRLPIMPARQRDRLAALAVEWSELLDMVSEHLAPALRSVGVRPQAFAEQVHRSRYLHLRAAGLKTDGI